MKFHEDTKILRLGIEDVDYESTMEDEIDYNVSNFSWSCLRLIREASMVLFVHKGKIKILKSRY